MTVLLKRHLRRRVASRIGYIPGFELQLAIASRYRILSGYRMKKMPLVDSSGLRPSFWMVHHITSPVAITDRRKNNPSITKLRRPRREYLTSKG